MKKLLIILTCVLSILFVFKTPRAVSVNAEGSAIGTGAKAAYLMEAGGGEVIFASNENKRLTIASMTKIMLLNVVFEAIKNGVLTYDEMITVSETAQSMGGSQVFLQAHKEYKAADLIKSVIVSSANDASVALAERLYGSETEAVDKFNALAREWGLENTLFSNVTGLPKPTQYSCAKDVAVMLDKLVSYEDYFKFSTIYTDELTHPDGKTTMLTNTNKLVRFYNGCDGGKTGYTDDAGFCLAATAKRGALRIISVVIGESDSKTRFKDVSSSFDYCFNNFSRKILFDNEEYLSEEIKVNCGEKDFAKLKVENTLYAFEKKGSKNEYTVSVTLDEKLKAPVKAGDAVGTITVYKNGVEYKSCAVVAAEDIDKLTPFTGFKKAAYRWVI